MCLTLCHMCKKTHGIFFPFFILCNFEFYLKNALVYFDIDWGIHKVKPKNAWNEKQKITMWVFFFYKYGKFWSISLDKKVDLRPLFPEECICTFLYNLMTNNIWHTILYAPKCLCCLVNLNQGYKIVTVYTVHLKDWKGENWIYM